MTRRPPKIVLVAWLLAAAAGCRQHAEQDSAPVVTVGVAPVVRSTIQQTVRADALITPRQQAAMVPKIVSPIRTLHVRKGERVRAGQLLVELESADLAGAAAESRASAAAAEATYDTASRATVPQELQKAELDVNAAKAALDAQQAVYDSRVALFREGAIAGKDVNDALVSLTQARTTYETARKQLDDLRSVGTDAALKGAAAQRDAARARRAASEAQLGYARLVSPIDGVVTDLPYYPGESPPAGAPVVTVMDVSQVIARSHVSPGDAGQLAVGNAASLLTGGGAAPIDGTVTQISPALDPGSTTVEVWVQAANPEGRLRPGTSVRAELVARTIPDTLVIPQAAVLTTGGGATFAIVVDNDNKPHLRKIAVGVRNSGSAQVTDGLDDGQRVATTGAFELFKLDPDVLGRTTVKIAPATSDEEKPDET